MNQQEPKIWINGKFLGERPSGIGRYAIEITKKLLQKNEQIRVVCPPKVYDEQVAKELKAEKIGSKSGMLWEQIDLRRELNKQTKKPLLLNFTSTAPLFYRHSIVTIHDVAFYANPSWYSKKAYWYLHILTQLLLATKPKQFVTVSDFSKRELMHYLSIPAEKITVIYNAVFEKKITQNIAILEKIKAPYILFVGNLDPRKNLVNLLKAYLSGNFKDLKLVIAGGSHKTFSQTSFSIPADKAQDILFLDYVSDEELITLYQNASLFVYPSLYEGFGIPPLEAMRYGCPVLVSDTASLPEVCGDAAFYCNPHEVEDITFQMKEALENKEAINQKKQLASSQLQKFSWEKSANLWLDLIHQFSIS